MRLLLSMILSFQIMSAGMASELGQKQEPSSSRELISALAEAEAKVWEERVRTSLAEVNKSGLQKFLNKSLTDLSPEDTKTLAEIQKITKNTTPEMVEEKPGQWVMRHQGHSIMFTLASLYEGQMFIDNEKFDFQGLTLTAFKTKLDNWEPTRKTTWFNVINNVLGIQDAYANMGVAALVLVAVGSLAYAVYNWKILPEQAVKELNITKGVIERKKKACEMAPESSFDFEEALDLVKPVKSVKDRVEKGLKQMMTSSSNETKSCYDLAYEASKELKIKIPSLNTKEQTSLETLGGKKKANAATDVTGALYEMCQSFNLLRTCMSTFADRNVNNDQYKQLDDTIKGKLQQIKPAASNQ